MMKKNVYDELKSKVDNLETLLNGGKGSGNFGHAGRPGKIGGSGNGQEVKISDIDKKITEAERRLANIDDEITTEEEQFGGDTSHLESLRQEAQDELDALRRERRDKKSEEDSLISSPDSSLGVTKKEFETAKKSANERGGKMTVEKTSYKTYIAGNKFYRREFDTKREADAFKSGYDYGDNAKDFSQVDYVRISQDGKNTWDVKYKKTDVGVHKSASFNNPIEAQRWTEGYNSKIRAIESEVPSEAWKKK